MRYENPQPTEGINYTREHPLKEFTQLLIGIAVVCLITISLLTYFAGKLAVHIPFNYEKSMTSQVDYFDREPTPQQQTLQRLADRLATHMALPEGMQITVHYDDSETQNAFATLGGNVVFFKGLIDMLETEQELAAVMAHEIAHIKLRHPIVATGRGLTLLTLTAFISGASSSTAGDWLVGGTINFQMMQFSRKQELAADAWAARALVGEYQEISGALSLFEKFAQLEQETFDGNPAIEAFRSHPYSENRRQALLTQAETAGWALRGEAIAVPLTTE